MSHFARRVAVCLRVLQRDGNLAVDQITATGAVVSLPGMRYVNGLGLVGL